nr:reverse transcriptase domain-containing protein [Tanacetum cinerariifolium]
MSWKMLMKMMTDKYCPRNEIRKLEMELWELKVKGTDLASYTQRFQELALLCGRMFSRESDKVEKYVGAKVVTLCVTVGLRQLPMMLTTRGALGMLTTIGALGQDRNRDVMSVGFKDILKENVLS